jgi:hypothetical protein
VKLRLTIFVFCVAASSAGITSGSDTIPVTADNFVRAESDTVLSGFYPQGFGKFQHFRELASLDFQIVQRGNRDTLYSMGVFDLDAGPVTITLPDPGSRYLILLVINEDHYATNFFYGAGTHTLNREEIGTRYVLAAIRMLVNPNDAGDVAAVHALQDKIMVKQPGGPGKWEIPNWDKESHKKIRDALTVVGATLPDWNHAAGKKDEVDPIRHLLVTATGWGANPEKAAVYLNRFPKQNDGTTVHKLTVKDVPVDGFWSVSVYDAQGYYEKNELNAYSLNNVTATKDANGSITVQFGGCDRKVANCLPIMPGWNYTVRLYRPRAEILNGKWTFPEAQPQ